MEEEVRVATEAEPLPDQEMPKTPAKPKRRQKKVPVPEPTELTAETPPEVNRENYVKLGGRWVEIKPTKLKYFRNRTAAIYNVLKAIPLGDFLAYKKGTFDEKRSSDQILFDFLTATFDDASLVTQYYDDITADDIERILEIFGRVNHISEKEEKARKNRETQTTT